MQSVAPQNRHITSLTKAFLSVHWDRERPLLLGYSGGPDSKALLYSLLECGIKPHIAHVDHGWREESRFEAQAIAEESRRLDCPFLSVRLEEKEKSEDAARKGRFTFFSKIFAPYGALLLAHHADDLAETILKRVLEGAHLAHLGGMREVSSQYGMKVWRPFLKVRRVEIIQFLEERSTQYFCDVSNSDPKYLRARMRTEIFPFLNEQFGKSTQGNLALLSERAFELKEYLDRQVEKVPIQKGSWGILVDLNGLQKIEQRHMLQKIASMELLTFSRDVLDTLLNWIEMGGESKLLPLKTKKILVDRGRVWVFSDIQRTQNQYPKDKVETI